MSVLATPDPSVAGDFVRVENTAHVVESDDHEFSSSPSVESPDDLLASAFPRFVKNRGTDVDKVVGSFVVEMKESLEQSFALGLGRDLTVQGRYGTERVDGEGSPVLWAEFYPTDLEAYLIPHPAHFKAVSSGGALFSDDMLVPERFLLGPARILLTLNSEGEVASFQPWLSQACVQEAESNFIAHVRQAPGEGTSVFGALVDQCVVTFMKERGLDNLHDWEEDGAAALACRGVGVVESSSSSTDGETVYNARFLADEASLGTAARHISCSVTFRRDDTWGLLLSRVRVIQA